MKNYFTLAAFFAISLTVTPINAKGYCCPVTAMSIGLTMLVAGAIMMGVAPGVTSTYDCSDGKELECCQKNPFANGTILPLNCTVAPSDSTDQCNQPGEEILCVDNRGRSDKPSESHQPSGVLIGGLVTFLVGGVELALSTWFITETRQWPCQRR